jgi:hypothetical protein
VTWGCADGGYYWKIISNGAIRRDQVVVWAANRDRTYRRESCGVRIGGGVRYFASSKDTDVEMKEENHLGMVYTYGTAGTDIYRISFVHARPH